MSEEVVIDLTSVPLKPIGKKEITQLEIALIIGTLYRPEILELIRDPIERSTWIDSLAVAAAAFARYKAGLTTSQIAEELGRSEVTIRSHLNQRTKAGKLIAETLEKIRRGELKIAVPFLRAPVAGASEEIHALRSELERLRQEKHQLEARIRELEETLTHRSSELDNVVKELTAYKKEVEELRDKVARLTSEKQELENKLSKITDTMEKTRQAISTILNNINEILAK